MTRIATLSLSAAGVLAAGLYFLDVPLKAVPSVIKDQFSEMKAPDASAAAWAEANVFGPIAELIPGRESAETAAAAGNAEAVRMPAVRGVSNYGWVQLPHGTQVELVRQDGDNLWVRWDGSVVRLEQRVAVEGAVTVKKAVAARPVGI